MTKKASWHSTFIKDLPVGAANILKQDALSIGADLAVPRGTILAQEKYVNAVLIGSTKHFEILAKKELALIESQAEIISPSFQIEAQKIG